MTLPDVFDVDFLAELLAQTPEVLFHRRVVREGETRQGAEDRVLHEAVLGDRERRAAGLRHELEGSRAAIGERVVGDAQHELRRRLAGLDRVAHGPVLGLLQEGPLPVDGFDPAHGLHVRAPGWVGLDVREDREERLGAGAEARAAGRLVLARHEHSDQRDERDL